MFPVRFVCTLGWLDAYSVQRQDKIKRIVLDGVLDSEDYYSGETLLSADGLVF